MAKGSIRCPRFGRGRTASSLPKRVSANPTPDQLTAAACKPASGTGSGAAKGAFCMPLSGQQGNSGRNQFRSPLGLWQHDLAVRREFPLRENVTLQFRAEAFNLFNHPNFNLPDNFLGSPTFGRITSARDPRHIQFGLKLLF